jgi:hypothetical protein
MDIRDFIKKFIEQHPNTYTDTMVRRMDSYEPFSSPLYKVIDNVVSWSNTKEGYYYYYFLQLRLALGVAQLFIENNDRDNAVKALSYARELFDYSSSFSSSKLKEGGMMISKRGYLTHKSYNKKLFDRLYELINKKSC